MANGKYQQWLSEDGLLRIEGWAREGLTDVDLAHNMGISPATLYVWCNKYPEISEALKRGKAPVDIKVENALLKRALGYSYEETMVEESEDGYKRRVTRKFIPPDVTAQIYWLKNRRPDLWRDRPPDEAEAADLDELRKLLGGIKSAF